MTSGIWSVIQDLIHESAVIDEADLCGGSIGNTDAATEQRVHNDAAIFRHVFPAFGWLHSWFWLDLGQGQKTRLKDPSHRHCIRSCHIFGHQALSFVQVKLYLSVVFNWMIQVFPSNSVHLGHWAQADTGIVVFCRRKICQALLEARDAWVTLLSQDDDFLLQVLELLAENDNISDFAKGMTNSKRKDANSCHNF